MDSDVFVNRWADKRLGERQHGQSYVNQICQLIGVPAPNEDCVSDPDYMFERSVPGEGRGPPGQIDCYKRGCFVMEIKCSGGRLGGWARDEARLAKGPVRPATPYRIERTIRQAKLQAEDYARRIGECPPFLIILDVGGGFELWSDFSRQGQGYAPFRLDGQHRFTLQDFKRAEVRRTLATVWRDPMSLDPSRASVAATKDIAGLLAGVLKSVVSRHADEDAVHAKARAAQALVFLSQCIFAMFADSIGLIRDHGFRRLLEDCRGEAHTVHNAVFDVCRAMDRGGYSSAVRQTLEPFGGGLFPVMHSVQITEAELSVLIEVSRRDWSDVEPTAFGTLLEQAADPRWRAVSGIHFTPRLFVETLVQATVMEPLRADWRKAEDEAQTLREAGDPRAALRVVRDYHRALRRIRVLDPACGTGNFLYVALQMMKTLESDVISLADELGARLSGDRRGLVGAGQFEGLDRDASAVGIARLVMRIGHLQWCIRLGSHEYGDTAAGIHHADALLPLKSSARPLTAGEGIRPTPWPDADFIVGNPPFMGAKDQRRLLGDDYVDALWTVRQGRFRSADLATYWWGRAAEILKSPRSRLRRFGFITTRSISQTFSRRVLEHHLEATPPIRLAMVIPDHPWTSGRDAACVRVAMAVVERGRPNGEARLLRLAAPGQGMTLAGGLEFVEERGVIAADFSVGPCVSSARPLKANARLASRGVQPMGEGFIVDSKAAARLAQSDAALSNAEFAGSPFRPYRNGRDLTDRPRDVQIIDLFGHDEPTVRQLWPGIYQHLLETVKPVRERNGRAAYRRRWWIFGEPRPDLRKALAGLCRYIVTVETGKHRWFTFLSGEVLADNRLVCIASDDPYVLGVLSSRVHQAWALAAGGRLEDRPIYAKGACFDRFPFPEPDARTRAEIGELAAELDQLRRRVLDQRPELTMTALYNARDRIGGGLRPVDDLVFEAGCVGVIDHLHREIDARVTAAFGWPEGLDDAEIIVRLVALNLQRSNAERDGDIRWIRPEFQRPSGPARGLGFRSLVPSTSETELRL